MDRPSIVNVVSPAAEQPGDGASTGWDYDPVNLPLSRSVASPSSRLLFLSFLLLGLTGFGGVLPMARRMLVERRRWLTAHEFADLLGLCQLLPGGNIINMSVAVGLRFRGVRGAAAALLGLIAAPSLIVIAMGMVYDRFHDNTHVRHMFVGLSAAAAGLLMSMALKLALPLRSDRVAIGTAGLCFFAIAVLRLPLVPTLLVLGPASMLAVSRLGR